MCSADPCDPDCPTHPASQLPVAVRPSVRPIDGQTEIGIDAPNIINANAFNAKRTAHGTPTSNRNSTRSSNPECLSLLQSGCRICSQFENFILIFQITFSHITQKHYCLFVCLSQSLSRSAELLPQKFNKTAKDAHKEQNMIKTTVRYKRVLRKRNKWVRKRKKMRIYVCNAKFECSIRKLQ